MRLLPLTELMRLTRIELFDLAARITNTFPDFPEGSPERHNAVTNLRNIRRMLAHRDFSPSRATAVGSLRQGIAKG